MSYALPLEMKQNQLTNIMKNTAHLAHVPVHGQQGMDYPYWYRNKVQMAGGQKDRKVITGFYQQRRHRIMETKEPCNVQDEKIDGVVETVRDIANQLGIPAYNERSHPGILRHIVVRVGKATNEVMIVLVTRTEKFPQRDKLIEQIGKQLPHIHSLMQNINGQQTNVILGKTMNRLYGEEYIHDKMDDLTF